MLWLAASTNRLLTENVTPPSLRCWHKHSRIQCCCLPALSTSPLKATQNLVSPKTLPLDPDPPPSPRPHSPVLLPPTASP